MSESEYLVLIKVMKTLQRWRDDAEELEANQIEIKSMGMAIH